MQPNATMREVSLAPSTTQSYQTSVKTDFVTADQIGVSYDTMPGNQPNTYGNFLAIWQNQDTIPWNQEPLKTFPIQTNTQAGSASFGGLDITNNSYIIGYSVGPVDTVGQKYGNICSTTFIPAAGSASSQQDKASSLTLEFIGTNSVAFNFNCPSGVTPMANGAWCGIWRSSVPSFNNPPDDYIQVNLNVESGTLAFNNFPIGRGLTYTIAFFMSGYNGDNTPTQTSMACSLTFTNS